MKPISIQLYTVRDVAAQDFPGTLRAIADIGYKGVEFAGLHGHDPKEIGKLIADLGMKASSSHTGLPTAESVGAIVETETALGNKRVISGYGPDDFKTVDAVKQAAARFNTAGELLKPYGMTFGFHNHWWEFFTMDGKYVYDILMAEAPDFFSELDVYWCKFGKADPVQIVSKYKSRLPLLHIKDGMLEEGKHVHTAVGSGLMDMPAIVGAADPNVLEWLIVELDACETDMMEAVRKSYEYLTSTGLGEGNK
jgi:sugar phosphate isomerase/epimerase